MLEPTPDAPARAREFLFTRLGDDLAGSVVLDDAALAVTEFVTNAINAGSSRIVVDLDLHRDHISIAVSDDAAGVPRLRRPPPRSIHGRGLGIVEAIARQWGTVPLPEGKRIWAELAVDGSDAWVCRQPPTR